MVNVSVEVSVEPVGGPLPTVPDLDWKVEGALRESIRVPMSWEEFLELPEHLHAEFLDGVVLVSPRPTPLHAKVELRLGALLDRCLPTLNVLPEVDVRVADRRTRVPDLSVFRDWHDSTLLADEVPIIAVEILSRSTRSEDTVLKWRDYYEATVEQYWIVDPDARTIDAYANRDTGWERLAHVDEASPRGEVSVGEYGVVGLDLDEVIPRPAAE